MRHDHGVMVGVGRALGALLAVTALSASASTAAATGPGVRVPPVAGVFDYQIGGAYRPARDVRIVDRDHAAHPAPGRYNICYVNAFQTQPEQHRFWFRDHRPLLLRVHGRFVEDPGWPGEYVLDTSTPRKRHGIARIVGRWMGGCARKGFDAVEPDNLDSWTRGGVHGALTRADNVAEARLLVARAHADGLAIAQKNTVQLARQGPRIGFDFAIAEECSRYHECAGYLHGYGRHVIEIEYTDNPIAAYRRACRLRGGEISIILRDRDVTPRGSRDYVYRHC
jgi:hypothetical protein